MVTEPAGMAEYERLRRDVTITRACLATRMASVFSPSDVEDAEREHREACERLDALFRSLLEDRERLKTALNEARAGLEFAVSRCCGCAGDFRCSPHLALDAARKAQETPDHSSGADPHPA